MEKWTKKLFKTKSVSFGIQNQKNVLHFEFELNDDVDPQKDIDYHFPDCGVCTKARLEGRKIKGTVELEKAQDYTLGRNNVSKFIYVHANDGRSQFKGDPDTKKRIPDPEKYFERLNVVCVVEVT